MSLTAVIHAVTAAAVAVLGAGALRAGWKAVSGTTLVVAWFATALAMAGWTTVALLAAVPVAVPNHLTGHLWYLTGLAALCPAVAVLGARRPVNRVWSVFVLLPLAAVLSLPVVSALWSHGAEAPLEIESPMAIAFLLVLAMGCGNYVGTRFTVSALLYAAAVVLVIGPSTAFAGPDTWITEWSEAFRAMGTACLALAVLTARILARHSSVDGDDPHRVWAAFRDTFGIVWAKRILDRVNWSAREENWPAELTFTGLAWIRPESLTDEDRRRTLERLQQTLNWLLKRFVDDEWIERQSGGHGWSSAGREIVNRVP